jgi:hypothetical protein
MNEKENVTIPYYVHEAEMARERKHSKMLFVLCLVIFMMLILTNGAWIYYNNQFQDTVTTESTITQDVDTGDGDAIVSGIGDIYGESKTDN